MSNNIESKGETEPGSLTDCSGETVDVSSLPMRERAIAELVLLMSERGVSAVIEETSSESEQLSASCTPTSYNINL